MRENFQVETFDSKSDRDARWYELRTRRNDDGSVGCPGLVRFSGYRNIPGGGKILPNYASRLELRKLGKDTTCVVHGRLRMLAVSTWSIAYPRMLPEPGTRPRKIQCEPSPNWRRARAERRRSIRMRKNSLRKVKKALTMSTPARPAIVIPKSSLRRD